MDVCNSVKDKDEDQTYNVSKKIGSTTTIGSERFNKDREKTNNQSNIKLSGGRSFSTLESPDHESNYSVGTNKTCSTCQLSEATSGYNTGITHLQDPTYNHLHQSKTCPGSLNNESKHYQTLTNNCSQCIDFIKRCDMLVNQIQATKQQYDFLTALYEKHKKMYVTLGIITLVLISCVICVVPATTIISRLDQQRLHKSDSGTTRTDLEHTTTPIDYTICFNCTELETDPYFTKHKVHAVYFKGESCCFGSITELYLSLQKTFQYQIDDAARMLRYSISSVNNELMIRDFNAEKNSSQEAIILRILQLNMPRERSVVHLVSTEGVPVREENTMSGRFHILKWNVRSTHTIRTGKARIDRDGLNIVVQSEAYYFLYTRLQFKANLANRYEDVLVTYTINRQRGSTSTYIHEAKESCKFTDTSQMHSSVSELVVHLSRFDQIFVSVSSSDIKFLSSDEGAHVFGLFEL